MSPQQYEVTESSAASLPLTGQQADALRAIGRRLVTHNRLDVDESDKSALECTTVDGVNWQVRVTNAVGVIGLPNGSQIRVLPKIPNNHLLYLLRVGGAVPRTTHSRVQMSTSTDFQDLVAGWFLSALETILRGGLRQSYVLHEDTLPVVRGRIDVPRATMDLARGKLQLACEFDELTEDTALNRVLAAAARRISRSSLMPVDLRRRARFAGYHLAGISPMRASDLSVEPDRMAAKYVDAIALARLLLAGSGVGLEVGHDRGASFLIPTPLVVESALRLLAAEALKHVVAVTKGSLSLTSTSMSVNPDLVFGQLAIGDVKYKVWTGSWIRSDLYQLVAFAAAYERTAALHVGFGPPPSPHPVQVGQTNLWRVCWHDDPGITPEQAAQDFQSQVKDWWKAVEALCASHPQGPDVGQSAHRHHHQLAVETSR